MSRTLYSLYPVIVGISHCLWLAIWKSTVDGVITYAHSRSCCSCQRPRTFPTEACVQQKKENTEQSTGDRSQTSDIKSEQYPTILAVTLCYEKLYKFKCVCVCVFTSALASCPACGLCTLMHRLRHFRIKSMGPRRMQHGQPSAFSKASTHCIHFQKDS